MYYLAMPYPKQTKGLTYKMVFKNNLYHTTLYERIAKLLAHEEWADCCFSVAGRTFKAHKLILATSSPVFEAMFYGPLSTSDDIIITDLEPETFQVLLNYIYTDKIDITCIEQGYALLYAARKYLLELLIDSCIRFIQGNISVENVTTILNYPEYMHEKQLLSDAIKVFCQHPGYIFREDKESISHICMKLILESNNMNINERNLIKNVFEWSYHYCEQNGLPTTFEARREALITNGLFKLLRFLTLNEGELNDIVSAKNNLLLPEEYDNIRIMQSVISTKEKKILDTLSPIVTPRSLLKINWYTCHRIPYKSAPPIVIDHNNYTVHTRMKVSKSLFIKRICIPARLAPFMNFSTYLEKITVIMSTEFDNKTVNLIDFSDVIEYDTSASIMFTEPFLVKKDMWYKISFIWPRSSCQTHTYIVKSRDSIFFSTNVGIEFDDMVSQSSTDGSFISRIDYSV